MFHISLLRAIGMAWQTLFGVDGRYHHLPVCVDCLQLRKGVTEDGNAPRKMYFSVAIAIFLSLKVEKGPMFT
jgi:hypothetical protein